MYNYNLRISIFSNDPKLQEIIQSIVPLEHFRHDITRYVSFNEDVINYSNIIIYDLDTNIDELLTHTNKKIILCTNEYKDSYSNANSIIFKPFNYNYVKKMISDFLKQISIEEELAFTKTCMDTTIDGIPDMIWIKDINGIHRVLNKGFCEVVGKTKEDMLNKDHYYIWDVSKDDPNSGADICKETEDQVIKAGHTLKFNEGVKNKNGRRELITYKSPIYDKYGRVVGTVGYGHDVTDMKNLNVENDVLLNSVPYAVLIMDSERKIVNVNNFFEQFFGVKKEYLMGMKYEDWTSETFHIERTTNEGGFTEGKTYPINGEEKTVELRDDTIKDVFGNVKGKVCIFRDVTKERKLEAQIIRNSNIDFMTNLYNRRFLDKYISSIEPGTPITLFSIDLDHFKSVNDTYGHKAGDDAIIMTADILNECFNKDLVVRMGGDEFIVVKIGEESKDTLASEAQNLLNTLMTRFAEKKEFGPLSASVGITQGILDANNFDSLLQLSDNALYKAKEAGRACYQFSDVQKLTMNP